MCVCVCVCVCVCACVYVCVACRFELGSMMRDRSVEGTARYHGQMRVVLLAPGDPGKNSGHLQSHLGHESTPYTTATLNLSPHTWENKRDTQNIETVKDPKMPEY